MSLRSPRSPLPLIPRLLLLAHRARVQPSSKAGTSASPSPDAGLTLLECLVAIVVITITVITITPPIFVATATRVQSRRAEQANQIAQGELDRIRAIVERSGYVTEQLPADAGTTPDANTINAAAGSPQAILSSAQCTSGSITTRYPDPTIPTTTVKPQVFPSTGLVAVDVDGDCVPEYAMQIFRVNQCIPSDLATTLGTPPYGFTVGIRVYSYTNGETVPPLLTERAVLGLTTGKREGGVGGNERKPLQVLISRVTRSGSELALQCASQ